MSKQSANTISRILSLALRHAPETLEVSLDENGWCEVSKLLKGLEQKGHAIDYHTLADIVESNAKKRFAFDDSGKLIRANQGHSLNIDLGLKSEIPPEYLFHGSTHSNILSIKANGLIKGDRQHVHLSTDLKTVIAVGKRHGEPIIIKIAARKMHATGYKFFLSENNVWLTDNVPPEYLVVSDEPFDN